MTSGPFQSRDDFLRDVRGAVEAQLKPVDIELAPREIEVVRLTCAGRTYDDIAAALDVSPSTVKSHRRRIAEKSGCSTGAELGAWAERRGLLGGVHVGR